MCICVLFSCYHSHLYTVSAVLTCSCVLFSCCHVHLCTVLLSCSRLHLNIFCTVQLFSRAFVYCFSCSYVHLGTIQMSHVNLLAVLLFSFVSCSAVLTCICVQFNCSHMNLLTVPLLLFVSCSAVLHHHPGLYLQPGLAVPPGPRQGGQSRIKKMIPKNILSYR